MSLEQKPALTSAAVIATRNRPEPLRRCIESIAVQSVLPRRVVVVDASDDGAAAAVVEEFRRAGTVEFSYERAKVMSAAQQRNQGACQVRTDIVIFLDDDVVLEPNFFEEIMAAFESDPQQRIGGVSGTIVNQFYTPLKGMNRMLLGVCTGPAKGSFAGRLLGPAINFLPEIVDERFQAVDWLPSTCTAYRTDVFRRHEFGSFQGYSFAEDVHLSARVAKTHGLLNATKARVFHEDLGQFTHKNWNALGESMLLNRHNIMTEVLGRSSALDHLRLYYFELFYSPVAYLAGGLTRQRVSNLWEMLTGKGRALRTLMLHRKHA